MEQRWSNTWRMTVIEKQFIEKALLSDLRIDGRGPFDYRNLTIQFGVEDGSSEVQLGQTRVMGVVTSQLVQPYRDRPNEGALSIYTEFSPMADPSFEVGRPGEFSVELGRIIDRGLRESRAVDMESLCVVPDKWVWSVRIDLHILDNGGNLVDAANIAALAALLTFRRPDCTVEGEGQEVVIHPPEVRDPQPLIVHHLPIAVTFGFIGDEHKVIIDPSHFEEVLLGGKLTATLNTSGEVCAIQKAGGEGVIKSVIMQCLRIASAKAGDITTKIKKAVESYNTERALNKVNRRADTAIDVKQASQEIVNSVSEEREIQRLNYMDISDGRGDDVKFEIHSVQKGGSNRMLNKAKNFIGGPSSWDPYSKGVDADALKASLASRAAVYRTEKMDISSPEEPKVSLPSTKEISLAPSSTETPATGEPAKRVTTLIDAVKPKHKRKMKTAAITTGAKDSSFQESYLVNQR